MGENGPRHARRVSQAWRWPASLTAWNRPKLGHLLCGFAHLGRMVTVTLPLPGGPDFPLTGRPDFFLRHRLCAKWRISGALPVAGGAGKATLNTM
ncbi:hypothetical protein SAMN04515678_105194 [Roseivivax sediminis]|uniref:Uncharacterized protein n=1 Tax=Roseivivax sediminis TaxID=936889 RepID=A0A1I1X1C3_9RHOB|nr:hypothetical protein SAMN04515678_105194 [Roseivivax sediminis]